MPTLLQFPDPVDEVSARLVAAGVVVMSVGILAGSTWLLVPLAYGFVARVATGPTLSPLGRLVTGVIRPRLDVAPRHVPGPPKRFAQGIGATLSVTAAVLYFGFGLSGPALALVAAIAVAAGLESSIALCIGCHLFALLFRAGVVPAEVCETCNDLSLRQTPAS